MSTNLKSTVNAKLFNEAITKAGKALSKSYVSVLDNVQVTFKEGRCAVTGTNLEHWLEVNIPANGDSFSFITSDMKSLLKACKHFDGDIAFEMQQDGKKVSLKSGSRIVTQDCHGDEFPKSPGVGEVLESCKANALSLTERISKIKYAVNVNSTQPIYTGICFSGEKLIAVDGFRIALNRSPDLNVDGEFVLPLNNLKLLEVFGKEDLTIEFTKKYAVFANSGTKLIIRRLAGEYMDFKRHIQPDADAKEIYVVNTAEYRKELSFLNDLIGSRNYEYVRFENGNLRVLTKRGNFSTKIKVSGNAEMVYGFECRYMLDALNHLKGAKSITFRVYSPLSPIIMNDSGSDADLALVLPARITDLEEKAA